MTEKLKVEAEIPVGNQTRREGANGGTRGQPGTWFAQPPIIVTVEQSTECLPRGNSNLRISKLQGREIAGTKQRQALHEGSRHGLS